MSNELSEESLPGTDYVWAAIDDYFSKHGLVRHQIESFDAFIHSNLRTIISENSDVTSVSSDGKTSYHLQFCNVCVHKPTSREVEGFERPLLPHAARLRGLTYSSSVCVDVVHDKVDRSGPEPKLVWRRTYHSVVLCRIPIMTGSSACYLSDPSKRDKECLQDRGGIFIINGHDKALVSQAKLRINVPFVFNGKGTRYGLICEVRSCHELKLRSTSTLQMLTSTPSGGGLPTITCRLPFLQCNIPLPTLYRVLGATTKEQAMSYMQFDTPVMEHIVRSLFDTDEHAGTSQEDAFEWIGREATREVTRERRVKYCLHILGNELLPHVGLRVDALCNQRKLHYLSYMVRRLLRCHLELEEVDDRDDHSNKRVDAAGTLMALLMRQLFRAHLKSISVAQHRLVESGKIETQQFGELISEKRITSGYKYCFATGNWNATKSGLHASTSNGVAQVIGRMTALSAQSNLRRINTPIAREGKCPKPRQLHCTAYGLVCPSESPEGQGCGLVNHMSLMTHIRTGCYSTPIAECILRSMDVSVVPLLIATKQQRDTSTIVFVNGVSIGFVENNHAAQLVAELRHLRRNQTLPFDCSITQIGTSVHVASDPGGLCRPLIIAANAHKFNNIVANTPSHENRFDALLRSQCIEYVDKHEESTLFVASRMRDLLGNPDYTHVELDPCLILGVMAAMIPFSNHDQAPRITYQSAMGKQACGWFATNWPQRMEAISHVQLYPQIPLCMTKFERFLRAENVPSGANVMVVICTLGGYNQEDSIIINQGSVDRGLFRSLVQRTAKDEERNGADAERFENPESVRDCAGLRVGQYNKLGPDHVVPPGTIVNLGDALIGKCISTADVAEQGEARHVVKRDKSTMQRHDEEAVVDMVLHTRTRDGTKSVKVRTRAIRIPQVGDKFSSRHGQKGVCGSLIQESEMPFDPRTGCVPDIVVNPHALPSRMTVGQLVEQLLCILCAEEGRIGDGTPFRENAGPDAISVELEARGLQKIGNRVFCNGQTGEMLPMLCFYGPTFYQRLKHMVIDKRHARARGPYQILTRQPLEGRAHMGGLRFGEMERDTLICHGASSIMLEFLLLKSDAFRALVCNKCGTLAIPAAQGAHVRNAKMHCRACGSTECTWKTMPYAEKLLLQELQAMHIAARLRLEDNKAAACDMGIAQCGAE